MPDYAICPIQKVHIPAHIHTHTDTHTQNTAQQNPKYRRVTQTCRAISPGASNSVLHWLKSEEKKNQRHFAPKNHPERTKRTTLFDAVHMWYAELDAIRECSNVCFLYWKCGNAVLNTIKGCTIKGCGLENRRCLSGCADIKCNKNRWFRHAVCTANCYFRFY